ncbi:vanadium-dependent haloperoxidase [Roseomonas sp. BN140053]|uniref:vanadium-dependent haloperoxidase n=1 Tax=Roseomonas sp. BN140053 TaxID=3391898 RepID=UPI0039E9F96C
MWTTIATRLATTMLLATAGTTTARAADPVTEWTLMADEIGQGAANWRSLAIMHMAMHDAWNAALPTYGRWFPPRSDEPSNSGALPQVAMAAAAHRVLLSLHPNYAAQIEQRLQQALARTARGPTEPAGLALGDAIGRAAVERRAADGYARVHPFPVSLTPGRWRPTPADFANSNTTQTVPFLFRNLAENPARTPPGPADEAFRIGIAEVLRVGGVEAPDRTPAQTEAGIFWAYQSSQRGYVHLGITLLDERPRPGGLGEHARIMSRLTTAMADSAILTWAEKEQFSTWRPVSAIRETMLGLGGWEPLLPTPPHPEYPSGHATDCFTGANVLEKSFPDVTGPVIYTAQTGTAPEENVGMGQHAQPNGPGINPRRRFRSFAAAAEECANSRIWVGAHIRPAAEESRRLGAMIGARAMTTVPALR